MHCLVDATHPANDDLSHQGHHVHRYWFVFAQNTQNNLQRQLWRCLVSYVALGPCMYIRVSRNLPSIIHAELLFYYVSPLLSWFVATFSVHTSHYKHWQRQAQCLYTTFTTLTLQSGTSIGMKERPKFLNADIVYDYRMPQSKRSISLALAWK